MADFSNQALADEINNDPAGIGYKHDLGNGIEWKLDGEIKTLLDAQNFKIDKPSINQEDVRATTTFAGYNTLGIDEQEWIRWMTPNSGQLRITADVKLQLTGRTLAVNGIAGVGADNDSFWAAAQDQNMAPAMLALIEVDGSRAEVLWGEGVSPSLSQIGASANL